MLEETESIAAEPIADLVKERPHWQRGLRPPWKKGQSGNPLGLRSFGRTIIHWYNRMQRYKKSTLLRIVGSESAPAAKIAAAQIILKALDGDLSAMQEACDRTHRKSTSHNQNDTTVQRVKRIIVEPPSSN